MTNKTYVLYHSNCSDGNGAAYAAYTKFGEQAEYIPVQYKKPAPQMDTGSDIFIVDFSYPRDILEDINSKANSLLVLDHHETAMDALKDLPYAQFDMERSGAMMAWNHFNPDTPAPLLIELIQDRDLWRFTDNRTRAIATILKDISDFRQYEKYLHNVDEIFPKGTFKLEFDDITISKTERKAVVTTWNGHRCALVNVTDLFSDIGERIYLNYDVDFVAMYFITSDGELVFSLRSKSFDVSKFALAYGGGGHPLASGMSFNLENGLSVLSQLYENTTPLSKFKL